MENSINIGSTYLVYKKINIIAISTKTLADTVSTLISACKITHHTDIKVPVYAAQWMCLGIIDYERSNEILRDEKISISIGAILRCKGAIYATCNSDLPSSVRKKMYDDLIEIIDQLIH